LTASKQIAVLNALVEGCSVPFTSGMTDVSIPTVLSLLVRVGEGCAELHDRVMRDLPCTHVERDEIWAFVGKKQLQVTDADDRSQVGDRGRSSRSTRTRRSSRPTASGSATW